MNKSKAAIFNKKPIVTFGKKEIKVLKKYTSKNPKNRFRICLHTNQSHPTQEMLICTKGFSYIRPHKHPRNVSESYHVLEGALHVYILNNKGKIANVVKLSAQSERKFKSQNYIYRVSSPLYHLTIPVTKWTVYHEVTTGPFKKNKMVNYAKFAPKEDDTNENINSYLSNLGIRQRLKD